MSYKYILLFALFMVSNSYGQTKPKKGITIYEYSDSGSKLIIKSDFIIPEEIYELGKGTYIITLTIPNRNVLIVKSVQKNQNEVDEKTFDVFQKAFSKIPLKVYCNDQPSTFIGYGSFPVTIKISED